MLPSKLLTMCFLHFTCVHYIVYININNSFLSKMYVVKVFLKLKFDLTGLSKTQNGKICSFLVYELF